MTAVPGMGTCNRAEKDEDVRVDTTTPTKDSPGERPAIRLWHIYGSGDNQAARIMEQLTREVEGKSNVTVGVDTAENEGYKTEIRAVTAANELLGISYTRSHEFLKPMADAGKVLEVNRYYNDGSQSHLSGAMMKGIQFDDGTYTSPLDNSMAMAYYNMEMMDRYGLEVLMTWDEFIRVCQTFVGNGIILIPTRGNEPRTIAIYYDLLMFREVGPGKAVDAAAKRTDYGDPGFLEAARKLRQPVDMGTFTVDSATALREKAEAFFIQGQALMYLNGSWTSSRVCKESSRMVGKVRTMPFPVTGSGKFTMYDFAGGPDSASAVSSSTKDLKLTVDLAKYVAMGLTVELYKYKSDDLPHINVNTGNTQLNPLMQETREYTGHAASYTIWQDNLLGGTDAARYLGSPGCLFRRDITPEEFISRTNGLRRNETDDRREAGWK